MARNGAPSRFLFFRRAIRNQDWAAAAAQSNRKAPVSAERNACTRELLEAATADDQEGIARLARCPM